jgi:uncharacterized membrane protein required for colicin V production
MNNIYNIIAFGFAIWLTVSFIVRVAEFLVRGIVNEKAQLHTAHGLLVFVAWTVWYITLVTKF